MSQPCPHSAGFLGSKFQRVFKNITNPERPELGRSVNGRESSQQGFSSVSIGARFSKFRERSKISHRHLLARNSSVYSIAYQIWVGSSRIGDTR